MKIIVGSQIGSYTFNKVAKTVALTGLATLTLDKILLITNVTRGTIIYLPTSTGKGGSISGNVITLNYNTNITTWNNSDVLQIFIDYPADLVPSATTPLVVTGTQQITRPSNTTPYSISDVVCDNTTAIGVINSVAYTAGRPFKIKGCRMFKSSNVTTNASFGIFIFNAPPTAIADNLQWTMLNADQAKYVGQFNLVMITGGTGSTGCMAEAEDIDIYSIPADGNLYYVITANATYSPTSGEVFNIYFTVEQA